MQVDEHCVYLFTKYGELFLPFGFFVIVYSSEGSLSSDRDLGITAKISARCTALGIGMVYLHTNFEGSRINNNGAKLSFMRPALEYGPETLHSSSEFNVSDGTLKLCVQVDDTTDYSCVEFYIFGSRV